VKCGKDILPGQERYEWSFRYGGTRRQHVTCGYPKQSQLTQSKMGDIYASFEDLAWGDTAEALVADLESIEETAEQVRSEYEEAAENFGGQGPSQESAENIELWISSLQSARSDIETAEQKEGESDEEFISRLQEIAQGAVDECP
jgi:hypothetical protein